MAKSVLLLFLSLTFSYFGFSQETRIKNLLGEGFRSIPAVNRPYNDLCADCELKFTQRWYADTSGIIYQNNYVLFRNYVTDPVIEGKSFAYFHELPVSNAEFQEFQNWVRDSIARERAYEWVGSDKEALQYLISASDKNIFDPERKDQYRKSARLNWNKKFSYSDPELIPLLVDMYLPQAERFYQQRVFDIRKFVFDYRELLNNGEDVRIQTTLITYPESWALGSENRFGETNSLGQLYEQLFPNAPVLVYSESQARAFCQWKQMQLQNELNQQHLNYTVSVNLPLSTELNPSEENTLTIPSKDYSENWKISVPEYQNFMNAIRDSLVLELIYESTQDNVRASSLLNFKSIYFNELELEMKKFDPSARHKNRSEFPFKPISTVYGKFKYEIDSLRNALPQNELVFRYYTRNPAKMAVVGKTTNDTRWERHWEIFEIDSVTGEAIGRTANLGYYNNLQHQTDALSHENFARFIQRITVQIEPLKTTVSGSLAPNITYEQALAFYNWKYPVWKAKPGDNWQDFVFPTKEQFTKIQNGETIVVPEHKLDFPSPTFRYVVTFIPLVK